MAIRREHIATISLSLTLIFALLLVTVTLFTDPFGASSSSSSPSSKYQRQQPLRDPRPLTHWQHRRRQPFRQPHPRTHPKQQQQDVGKVVFQHHQPLPRAGEQAVQQGSVSVTGPMNNNVRGKSWPQLVGLDAEEAKKKILEEHPNFQVQVVPAGGMVTMDLNLRRVRIFKDANQKVSAPPKLG